MVCSPVIVRINDRAIGIVQLEHWIEQGVRYAKRSKGWADAAHDNRCSSGASPQINPPINSRCPNCAGYSNRDE